jgi:hypothetical protein
MSSERVVICIKWGDLFGPDYVNVLHRACRANITGPFQFVCLTPDGAGLDPNVIVHPIPDIGLTPDQWYTSRVWPKIAIFAPELAHLGGRCLFIDLDMMITGALDEMFEATGGFISLDGGKNWWPRASGYAPMLATGVFAFDLGGQSQIMSAFLANKDHITATYPNEQTVVGEQARDITYWPHGWVISFKRWLRRPLGVDMFVPPKAPPAQAKIIAFHGTPRPFDLVSPKAGFWDRPPHMGRGQVTWVYDYWVKYGGIVPSTTGD